MIQIALHFLELIVYRPVLLSKLVTFGLMMGMQLSNGFYVFGCAMNVDIKFIIRVVRAQLFPQSQVFFRRVRNMYMASAGPDKVQQSASMMMVSAMRLSGGSDRAAS